MSHSTRSGFLAALSVAGLMAFAPTASGEILTFQFTGTVTENSVQAGPFAAVQVGEVAIASYSFDSEELPFLTVPPMLAYYAFTEGSMSVTLGGVSSILGPQPDAYFRSIWVANDNNNGYDAYIVNAVSPVPGSPSASESVILGLTDHDGTMFDSTALPLILDLAEIEVAEGLYQPAEGGNIHFTLDSLVVTPVPAAWAFLVLAGLPAARRRR